MQLVEGVEKFLLGALPAGDELDIVHHEDIHPADLLPELIGLVALDGADELIGEALAGHVKNLPGGILLMHKMADGLHQMGFAQPHAPIDKERVIGLRRALRHGQRRRVGKAVAHAHHEAFEGILRVQMGIVILLAGGLSPTAGFDLRAGENLRPHDFAGGLGETFIDERAIALLHHIAHAFHVDAEDERIALQHGRGKVAVDPGVIGNGGHCLHQQLAGPIP